MRVTLGYRTSHKLYTGFLLYIPDSKKVNTIHAELNPDRGFILTQKGMHDSSQTKFTTKILFGL
jgi:hypothetical protein